MKKSSSILSVFMVLMVLLLPLICTADPGKEQKQADLNRSLIRAIEKDGALSTVRQLLDKGADIHAVDHIGDTTMEKAIFQKRLDIVQLLLARGYGVNHQDQYGRTPLFHAALLAWPGKQEIAELLLEKGAAIHMRTDSGDTALMYAAMNGTLEIVKLLITHGADVGARDKYNDTVLHAAGKHGSKEATALLIQKGADVMARSDFDYTPLHLAAFRGHKDVVALLLAHGARLEDRDKSMTTPLIMAGSSKSTGTVKYLLDQGADINASDKKGDTVLSDAAYCGTTETVKLLIQRGVNIHQKTSAGLTPLFWAAANDRAESARALLQAGVGVDAAPASGRMNWRWAMFMDDQSPVKEIFLKEQNDFDLSYMSGCTPLIIAAINGSRKVMEVLLDAGADINARCATGYTPPGRGRHPGPCRYRRNTDQKGRGYQPARQKGLHAPGHCRRQRPQSSGEGFARAQGRPRCQNQGRRHRPVHGQGQNHCPNAERGRGQKMMTS